MKMTLKRILPGLVLACCLTLPAMAQQTRIATIDLRKVFDKYWKRESAEAALKEHGAELDKEYKSMLDDYNKTKDDYSKLLAAANDQSVSAEERDKRKSGAENKLLEIKTSENTIRTFEANAREQLDSQRKRMRETILGEIRTAITAKAKAQAFTLVIDSAAETVNNTPFLLYTTGDNDMTDDILKQLNAAAPPSAAPAIPEPPKADEKKGK